MLKKQKGSAQRNITPSFIIMKRRNANKMIMNKQAEQHKTNTDRSSSKASKCSFETYERRVLNLSKLKNHKNLKHDQPPPNYVHTNKTFDTRERRTSSNDKVGSNGSHGRENQMYGLRKGSIVANNKEKLLSKKRSSGSGKILLRPDSRSNSKRNQDSLEKQQQQAKMMNVDLLVKMMKQSQTPNYMNKLKMKRTEKQHIEKKKLFTKGKLLNIEGVQIKGQEAIDGYEIFGELGKGAYGVVRMGINKVTGEKVAIKYYQKKHLDEHNRLKNLERQIMILAKLSHPTIARLIEVVEAPAEIFLVLEYGGANSLYNYLLSKSQHRLSEAEAKKFLLILSQAISYLHEQDIVHRDIKAENILINRYKQIKLIDFGFSLRSTPPSTIDTFCGTPTYMAPEIVSKIDHVPIYTDMWSLGILFYVMLQGNYPFRSKTEEQLFDKIRKGKFEYLHNDISNQSKHIIQSLLRVNPYKRLTIKQLLSDRFHAWFQEGKLDDEST